MLKLLVLGISLAIGSASFASAMGYDEYGRALNSYSYESLGTVAPGSVIDVAMRTTGTPILSPNYLPRDTFPRMNNETALRDILAQIGALKSQQSALEQGYPSVGSTYPGGLIGSRNQPCLGATSGQLIIPGGTELCSMSDPMRGVDPRLVNYFNAK